MAYGEVRRRVDAASQRKIDAFIEKLTERFCAPPVSIIMRHRGEVEMAYERKPNTGALFNDSENKSRPEDRDYAGSLDVGGVEHWVSGYVRTSKTGKKYMSLSVKPKIEKLVKSEKSPAEDIRDEIPF